MSLLSTKDTDTAAQNKKNNRVSARELAELAVICVLMFIGKEALRMIPNVHPVTVLILLAVILYGWKALYPVFGFVFLEIFIYGFGIWTFMYLFVWPVLVMIAMPLRSNRNWLVWAGMACIYGLSFGALCYLPYIFISGPKAAFALWVAGIPFDIVHGISNFVTTILLLPVLYRTAVRLKISGETSE